MAVRVEPGYIEQLNEIYHFFSDGIQDVLCCHWCNPMEIFHDVFRVFTDENSATCDMDTKHPNALQEKFTPHSTLLELPHAEAFKAK